MPHQEIVDKVCRGSNCENGRGYCILSEILERFGHKDGARIPEGSDCHEGKDSCVLKDRIMETGFSDKILMQMKCLEIYKWNESEREDRDIGWDEAMTRWVRKGYAERFAEVYDSKMEPRELYRKATFSIAA